MSVFVETPHGRLRRVSRGGTAPQGAYPWALFECPGCGEWLTLSVRQFMGREPILHEFMTRDDERRGCGTCVGPFNFANVECREIVA